MNRLNFLYQASVLFASASTGTASDSTGEGKKGKGKGRATQGEGGREGETEDGRFLIPTQAGTADLGQLGTGEEVESIAGPSTEIPATKSSSNLSDSRKCQSRNHDNSSALPGLSRMMVQTLKDVSTKGTVRMYVTSTPSRPNSGMDPDEFDDG